MMAIAAVSARLEVALLGNPAEFESLRNKMGDGFLNSMHFLLGVEVTTGDGVVEEALTIAFEFSDILVRQLAPGLLLVLEVLPSLTESLVLATDLIVAHERVQALPDLLKFGLIKDGLAKFLGFLNDAIFRGYLHSMI
jgi:hypothetical protein